MTAGSKKIFYFVKGFFMSENHKMFFLFALSLLIGGAYDLNNQLFSSKRILLLGLFLLFLNSYYEYYYILLLRENFLLKQSLNIFPAYCSILNDEGECILLNDSFISSPNSNIDNISDINNFLKSTFHFPRSIADIFHEVKKTGVIVTQEVTSSNKIWKIYMSPFVFKNSPLYFFSLIDITPLQPVNNLDKLCKVIINKSSEGYLVTDLEGKVVFSNESFISFFKDNFIGRNLKDISFFQPLLVNNRETVIQYSNNNLIRGSKLFKIDNYLSFKFEVEKIINNAFIECLEDAPVGAVFTNKQLKILYANKYFYNQCSTSSKVNLIDYFTEKSREIITNYSKEAEKVKLNPILVGIEGNNNISSVNLYIKSLSDHLNIFYVLEESLNKDLNSQYMHSQRLLSLGTIIGGIAHDFNNIITSILGYTDAILSKIDFSNPFGSDLTQIKHNASKGANLVMKILNISRKHTPQEKVLDIHEVISELLATMGRIIGENIEVRLFKGIDTPNILMNETSFEQILMNLIINARDAMPGGGTLTITTDLLTFPYPFVENGNLIDKGDYVEITVTDVGVGIPTENIKKIFEEFFTTKNDKGTGFGLSIVNTIVREKKGFIRVNSKINYGTTFKVYLPAYYGIFHEKVISPPTFIPTPNKQLLFVDDDNSIRTVTVRGLRDKKLNVLEAKNAHHALEVAKKTNKLDLLITDIGLPGMNGVILREELKKLFPNLKTIFISGHTEEDFNYLLKEEDVSFLPKPFLINNLYELINNLMNNNYMENPNPVIPQE